VGTSGVIAQDKVCLPFNTLIHNIIIVPTIMWCINKIKFILTINKVSKKAGQDTETRC